MLVTKTERPELHPDDFMIVSVSLAFRAKLNPEVDVNMNQHVDFVQYYDPNIKDPQPANSTQATADNIDGKWNSNKTS
jgi:hypothetical protein